MSDQPVQDAAVAPLAPPMETLTLEAPAAVLSIPTTSAPQMAPAVPASAVPMLDQKVDSYLEALMRSETKSPEYEAKATEMRTMGDEDIRRAAESSNRLLQSPVKALQEGGLSQGSKVGKTLLELRRTVEELDPSQATGAKKVLGMIPFGDKINDYFRKYQSAQSHLNGILHSLRNGQDELQRDNVALNLEKQQLWDSMGRLNQYVYIAEKLDTKLAAQVATLDATAPAIDIVIKNNIELIKGVDRATTTTISALRTAVIVAQALGNQQLVLDQITALNTTTSGLIERTSEMLKDNSIRIQEQAASATIGLPQLQRAFQNIYATMDAIDTFKVQALDNMAATIGTLETEVAKSRSYLDRVQRQDQRIVSGTLDLGRQNI